MRLFKITYPDKGITQLKVLIPHSAWMKYLCMKENTDSQKRSKNIFMFELTNGFDFFTDKSPLAQAITTKRLVLGDKEYPVTIVEIDNN